MKSRKIERERRPENSKEHIQKDKKTINDHLVFRIIYIYSGSIISAIQSQNHKPENTYKPQENQMDKPWRRTIASPWCPSRSPVRPLGIIGACARVFSPEILTPNGGSPPGQFKISSGAAKMEKEVEIFSLSVKKKIFQKCLFPNLQQQKKTQPPAIHTARKSHGQLCLEVVLTILA